MAKRSVTVAVQTPYRQLCATATVCSDPFTASMMPYFLLSSPPSFHRSTHPKYSPRNKNLPKPRYILRSCAWSCMQCMNRSRSNKYSPVLSRYCRLHDARAKCNCKKQPSTDLQKTYLSGMHCCGCVVYGRRFVVPRLRFRIQSPMQKAAVVASHKREQK